MLANKDFQTQHLIGWQHIHQGIKSHVRKSLLTNMEFNMDFTEKPLGQIKVTIRHHEATKNSYWYNFLQGSARQVDMHG